MVNDVKSIILLCSVRLLIGHVIWHRTSGDTTVEKSRGNSHDNTLELTIFVMIHEYSHMYWMCLPKSLYFQMLSIVWSFRTVVFNITKLSLWCYLLMKQWEWPEYASEPETIVNCGNRNKCDNLLGIIYYFLKYLCY